MSFDAARRWVSARRFDTNAALLGLFVAVLLFPLRFLAHQVYIETIPVVLGLACTLYLLSAYVGHSSTVHGPLPASVARILPSVALASMAAVVLLTIHASERTLVVYALTALAAVAVLFQVLFASEDDLQVNLLLLQVVVLAAAIRLPVLYTSPGFIGIDVWTHVPDLAARIAAADSLEAISGNKHYAAPLYHLLVVASAQLFDVTLRNALLLSVGLLMPLASLGVYATASLLVDQRWAVLAAAVYAVGDYVIEWGFHLIPTSVGLLFFVAVIHLIVRLIRTEYRTRDFVLLVSMTVAVVLTHQVSSFIMLVVLGASLVTYILAGAAVFDNPGPLSRDGFGRRESVNLVGLFVFDLGLITFMWSLTPHQGDSFLETILSYFRETLVESAGFLSLAGDPSGVGSSAGPGGSDSTLLTVLPEHVDVLGFLLLLGATVVGSLYVINRDRAEQSSLMLLLTTVTMLVFVLGLPLFGIRNFIPQRWFAFLYVPMAVLGVVGLRHLSRSRPRALFAVVLLVFALAYPGAMVASSDGAIDNPLFEQQRTRLSFTEQELAAVSTVGEMTGSPDSTNIRPEQVLFTDHPYQTVFDRTHAYPADTIVAGPGDPIDHGFVLYREYQSDGASRFVTESEQAYTSNAPREAVCRSGMAVLYTNGDVTLCKNPGGW